jgi:alkylhydroperoxidase family enzyme
MARLPMIDGDDWPAELRAVVDPTRLTPLEQGNLRFYAHRPELAVAYARFMQALRAPGAVSPRLRELLRLRVAFHNQCRSCMAVRYGTPGEDGVEEDLVCQLEQPEEAPDLIDAERVALRFADRLATDHLAITDATFAELREHFDDGQIVEIGLHVASYVGFGRLSSAWDMVNELPDRFLDRDGPVTPWGAADAVRIGGAR